MTTYHASFDLVILGQRDCTHDGAQERAQEVHEHVGRHHLQTVRETRFFALVRSQQGPDEDDEVDEGEGVGTDGVQKDDKPLLVDQLLLTALVAHFFPIK